MKHERCYLMLARGVEWLLPRLCFAVPWQERVGHGVLAQLNRVAARWIYEAYG